MSKKNSSQSPTKSTDSSGAVHAAKGYKAMKAAPDTTQYEPSAAVKGVSLPPKVDLRPFMSKVEDQGQTSSCVANAVAGAYEYWIKKITGKDEDVSRLFVYYNARWRNGDANKDEGSVIQLAMKGLGDFGVCPEPTWPFEKKILTVKPNRDSYKQAADFRVKKMSQVPLELDAWKRCLAQGLPIVFGCVLFDSFDQCNQRHGVVPMPSPDDLGRAEHGGHSMCAVGYSDVDKVFIIRNSWGDQWGDKGYCYMPYNYLMNPKFNDGDCWVFTPDQDLPSPQDAWVTTTTSVINDGRGVNFEINPYSITAYTAIAISLFEGWTYAWNDTISEDYSEYTSFVESESWSEMEEYSIEEAESFEESSEESEETDEEEDDSDDEEEEDDSDDEEEEDDSDDEEEEDDSDDEEEEDDSDDEEEEDDSDDEEEEDDSEDEEEEDDSEDEEEEDDSEDEEEEDDGGDDEGGDEEE